MLLLCNLFSFQVSCHEISEFHPPLTTQQVHELQEQLLADRTHIGALQVRCAYRAYLSFVWEPQRQWIITTHHLPQKKEGLLWDCGMVQPWGASLEFPPNSGCFRFRICQAHVEQLRGKIRQAAHRMIVGTSRLAPHVVWNMGFTDSLVKNCSAVCL